jgi:hypothetical protein
MGARNQETRSKKRVKPAKVATTTAPRAARAETVQRLAKGTGSELDPQTTNGICFASRCNTVDEFVATFHRYCENSAIFIPDARRAVGTDLAFSFELADAVNVLLGVGNVVEEFSDADNRFARPGIVVSVKKLKRDSIDVFKRMLAMRSEAHGRPPTEPAVDPRIPRRALGRAMTGPIMLEDVRAARRPTRPLEVQIPAPTDKPTAKPRANTMLGLGLPAITKLPTTLPVLHIPDKPLRIDVRGSRPVLEPAPIADAAPEAIEPEEDTQHDDFPFALRNELRLREERTQVKVADVDSGWDVEPTAAGDLGALPSPDTIFTDEPSTVHDSPAAQAMQFAREPASAHEAAALPPPPVDELPVGRRPTDAIPVLIARVHSDAATTPRGGALPDVRAAAHHPLRRRVMIAIASAVLVAVPAFIGLQSLVDSKTVPSSTRIELTATPSPEPALEQCSEPVFELSVQSTAVCEPPPPAVRPIVTPAKQRPTIPAPKRALTAPAVAPKRNKRKPACTTLDCV